MIVYKIKDNKIVGISRKDDTYQLGEGEYSSNIWYQKPFFTGTEVVESITQEEIAAKAEQEADSTALAEYNKEKLDGEILAGKLMMWAKRQNLTPNQISALKGIREDLRDGDWVDAQTTINAINRPSGVLGIVYDKVKAEIDSYLL